VQAGNLVAAEKGAELQARLTEIRDMNRDELKAAYKEQLRKDLDDAAKGAGVGLIEMARRATKPIEFDFMEIDANYTFFALKTSI